MESKEIITRVKHQLEDGYIDLNDSYDEDEMNYVRKAIYDLELYKKALYLAIIDYCTLFGVPPKKILKKEIDNETKFYMERAKGELENGK